MKNRRPAKKFTSLPVWPLLLIGAAIIVGSFSYKGFQIYTQQLLGEILMDLVRKETDSLYTISYDQVRFNVFSNRLSLTNFSLSIDSLAMAEQDSFKVDYQTFYQAQIPELTIKANRFWDVYFKNELKITGLKIKQPVVDIISYPTENEPATLTFEAGNLYNLINNYLDVFQIGDFEMQEAALHYEKRTKKEVRHYNIGNLSLLLKNFVLDSTQVFDSTKVFFTDKILMNVKNQVIYLPDSIHLLTFESFTISTDPSEISFQNLWLLPRTDVAFIQPKNNKLNIYHILVPELKVTGVDYEKAYRDNSLNIDSISLVNPHFSIDKKDLNAADSSNSVENNDLSSLATYFFDHITVKNFDLDSALFEVALQLGTRKQSFTVDNVSLAINNFQVDTAMTRYRFDKDFTYFDDIEILVKNYQFNLPDSIHTLKVKNFNLSTSKSKIVLDSVSYTAKYKPDDFTNTKNLPNLYNITVPNLTLTGLDVNKVLDRQIVEAKTLNMQDPDINLFTYEDDNLPEKKKVKPDSLYAIITSILNSIEIEDFTLAQANFKHVVASKTNKREIFFSDVNMRSANLQIDSNTYLETDRLLDADNIHIDFANCYFHLFAAGYLIDASGGYLSGEVSKQLYLEDVKFVPIPSAFSTDRLNRPLLELQTHAILLKDLNLKNVLSQKNYRFSEVKLTEPKIMLYFRKNKDPATHPTIYTHGFSGTNNISHLSIELLEIEEGNIKIFEDSLLTQTAIGIQASVTDFDITPDQMGSSFLSFLRKSNYFLAGKNYSWLMPDSIHRLDIANFSTSNLASVIKLEGLSVQPVKKPAESSNIYRISAPFIEIKDHNAQQLSNNTGLNIRRFTAKNPVIQVTLGYDTLQPADTSGFFFLDKLPAMVNASLPWLAISDFAIENAQININQHEKNGHNQFTAEDASINIDRLYIDSLTVLNNKNFFFSNQIAFKVKNYAHSLAHQADTVHINDLTFSSADSTLMGRKVFTAYQNNNLHSNKNGLYQYEINIPEFELKGLDVFEAYRYKKLKLGDVRISQPEISLSMYAKSNKENSVSLLKKNYTFPEVGIHSVSMRSFALQEAQLNLTVNSKQVLTPYQLTNTSLSAKNIYVDTATIISPHNLFFSDQVQFKTENIAFDLPDGLHHLDLKEIGIASSDSSFYVKNLHLSTKLEKEEVAPHFGYQKGWLSIENDSLRLSGIRFYDLLYNDKLQAHKLLLSGLRIKSYKDRAYPIADNKNPPTFHEILQATRHYLNIDSIEVNNGNVDVEIMAENKKQPGRIFFTDLRAQGTHFTNDSSLIAKGISTRLDASAYLMGTGLLQANFVFDLSDKNGRYWFNAHLHKMDMLNFNRILEPIASMKVRSGEVNKVNVSVEANDDYAIGTMDFFYDKLYISILDNEDYSKQGFNSFIANTFVINSNNPNLFKFKKGTIYSERDERKLIFDQWFKSCLSGIISSVGVGNNKKEIKKVEDKCDDETSTELDVQDKP